jgi:hypothetical protein
MSFISVRETTLPEPNKYRGSLDTHLNFAGSTWFTSRVRRMIARAFPSEKGRETLGTGREAPRGICNTPFV